MKRLEEVAGRYPDAFAERHADAFDEPAVVHVYPRTASTSTSTSASTSISSSSSNSNSTPHTAPRVTTPGPMESLLLVELIHGTREVKVPGRAGPRRTPRRTERFVPRVGVIPV